jgi:hypothetical protein
LLMPFPWQLLRISHGNYHWPGSDLRPLQFHTPCFFEKTLGFCNFARVLYYFLDDLNRFLKCFWDIFSKFGYWFKDCKSYVLVFPGKTTNKYLPIFKPRKIWTKRIFESASYKQVFYSILFMLYLISHKIDRLNLSLTMKCTLFVKKTAFCWGFWCNLAICIFQNLVAETINFFYL